MTRSVNEIQSEKSQRLVIVGTGEQAEIAYEYFTCDSQHDVVGFCVEEEYKERSQLYGLPIVTFDTVTERFSPENHHSFVAVSHSNVNKLRKRLYDKIKTLGYQIVSYVSSRSVIDKSVKLGENCFIFEGVVIQRKCKIGDGATVWIGSTIAHRSELSEFVTVAPQVSVAGFSYVGQLSFLGTNSTVSDNIKIGMNVQLGAGSVAISNLQSGKVYVGNPAEAIANTSEYRDE